MTDSVPWKWKFSIFIEWISFPYKWPNQYIIGKLFIPNSEIHTQSIPLRHHLFCQRTEPYKSYWNEVDINKRLRFITIVRRERERRGKGWGRKTKKIGDKEKHVTGIREDRIFLTEVHHPFLRGVTIEGKVFLLSRRGKWGLRNRVRITFPRLSRTRPNQEGHGLGIGVPSLRFEPVRCGVPGWMPVLHPSSGCLVQPHPLPRKVLYFSLKIRGFYYRLCGTHSKIPPFAIPLHL